MASSGIEGVLKWPRLPQINLSDRVNQTVIFKTHTEDKSFPLSDIGYEQVSSSGFISLKISLVGLFKWYPNCFKSHVQSILLSSSEIDAKVSEAASKTRSLALNSYRFWLTLDPVSLEFWDLIFLKMNRLQCWKQSERVARDLGDLVVSKMQSFEAIEAGKHAILYMLDQVSAETRLFSHLSSQLPQI